MQKRSWFRVIALALGLALSACATTYQPTGFSSFGFSDQQLEPTTWRVSFSGNGYTTLETVQTYWLYRAADVTLAQGFDGFAVLTNMQFVRMLPGPVKIATTSAPVIIPIYQPMPVMANPSLQGDIQLLKLPFQSVPGKVFNAADLKAQLDPLVTGPKCDKGNVCPHAHHYIYGDSQPTMKPDAKPAN